MKFRQRRNNFFQEYYSLEGRKIMLYGNNSNREIKLKRNPLWLIKQRCSGMIAACFPPALCLTDIELPLNSRLLPAVIIPCPGIAFALNISNKKNQNLKKICTLFKQRVFESNQYDNLSPPFFIAMERP